MFVFFFAALFRGDFYVAFFASGPVTGFADLSASTEAFAAFDGHDAAAVADVAFNNSLFGG